MVDAAYAPGEIHLTEAEKEAQTAVQWHTFDEMVRLIEGQQFERVQGKYLRARDVAALEEYVKEML